MPRKAPDNNKKFVQGEEDEMRLAGITALVAIFGQLLLSGPLTADIYVGSTPRITVYPDTANGDVAPIRTLEGNATGILITGGIALDTVHGELFAIPTSLGSLVSVYPIEANGNQGPLRTVGTGSIRVSTIAVDPVNNELYVVSTDPNAIKVFSRTADGEVAPIRTIEGAATGLDFTSGIFVDLLHDEIFVAAITTQSVRVFPRLADGNVAPIRTLTGPATGFVFPQWLFVSNTHDELYVSDRVGVVSVFSRTANGNTSPIRMLSGDMTTLVHPQGVYLNTSDELLVAEEDSNSVLVFPRLANGDVAPIRQISGANTLMLNAYSLVGTNAVEGASGLVALPFGFADGFESSPP